MYEYKRMIVIIITLFNSSLGLLVFFIEKRVRIWSKVKVNMVVVGLIDTASPG